ncbi:hypothetical protein Tco_0217464, partial [Tanacetum coccineum]
TVSKVPDTEDTEDTKQFIYTVDMFRDTLKLPVETPENPFVAPANIHTIEAFMNRTMFKVFNRCLTTRTSSHDQTKINISQLFHAVINRTNIDYAALLWLEEDYHSIKDDVPLVSIYTTLNVSVQGMLIPDAFLTAEIREIDDFKENTPRAHRLPTIYANPLETKKRKQTVGESSSPRKSLKITIKQRQIVAKEKDDDDYEVRIEPVSHKENPKFVVDDDDKAEEKKSDDMGSLEIRNEETQTTIPTPLSSPRKILSSDKKIDQDLTNVVSIPTTTITKHSQVKKRISSKYSHLLCALPRMCRRQGYMNQDMERKCVITAKFWETHNKIDEILREVVLQIAENVTTDLIEYNLKPCIANTIIEDRDAFRLEVPALVSQEFNAHAPTIIEKLFKRYVQSNVVHIHPTTTTSINTDSLASLQYQLEDDFHSHHDEHQNEDAHPEGGEKSEKKYVVPTGRVIATDSVIVATSGYVVPAAYDISPGRVK